VIKDGGRLSFEDRIRVPNKAMHRSSERLSNCTPTTDSPTGKGAEYTTTNDTFGVVVVLVDMMSHAMVYILTVNYS